MTTRSQLIACFVSLACLGLFAAPPAYADAKADQKYNTLKKSYDDATKRFAKCGAGKEVKWGYSAWLSVFNDAHFFNKAACETGPADARCKDVAELMKKAGQTVAGYFKSCFAHPKYDWYDVIGSLVKMQNRKPYLEHMAELDAWMNRLAKDKSAYWEGEKKAAKGWKNYVRKEGPVCYPTSKPKGKKIEYAFDAKAKKAYLTCIIKQPRSKLNGKPKDDFYRIKVEPGAYYEENEVKAKVKWSGDTGAFTLSLADLRSKLAAKSVHIGPWSYITVELYQAWITGKGWTTKGGKRVWADIWTNSKLAGATLLLKLR